MAYYYYIIINMVLKSHSNLSNIFFLLGIVSAVSFDGSVEVVNRVISESHVYTVILMNAVCWFVFLAEIVWMKLQLCFLARVTGYAYSSPQLRGSLPVLRLAFFFV